MADEKKYYRLLDVFRILLCAFVFLYHLDYSKGGYLAVCCFFSLSGFLSCYSFLKKKEIKLFDYYKSRIMRLYLPLVIVCLITLAVISFIPDIFWVSLKPETNSVLLGYNNFWQINANLDYFARHVDSPFMHLWYISILLQFELCFPLIFLGIKGLGNNNKTAKTVISGILALSFIGVYLYFNRNYPLTTVYYNTFSRVFSLFIGMFFAYLFDLLEGIKSNTTLKLVSLLLLVSILVILFVTIEPSSRYNALAMILSSIFTGIIIYLCESIETNSSKFDVILKKLSAASYLFYLVQYPVIYLFQYVSLENVLTKNLSIFALTLFISLVIEYALTVFKKPKISRIIVAILVLAITSYGLYQYVIAQDHTEEMNQLEEQLEANQQDMLKQQEEYAKQLAASNQELEDMLAKMEDDQAGLENLVKKLPIVSIGDSVMLGASDKLTKMFPNLYCDAAVSRTGWVADGILSDLKKKKLLAKTVVIHLGTNGDCSQAQKKKIMDICSGCDVYWVSVTNDKDVKVNSDLKKIVNKYSNAYYIDWYQASKGHADYFISDGIHLTSKGKSNYAKTIYNAIYDVYLQRLNQQKQELIDNQNAKLEKIISFYGNDLLTNIYDGLSTEYPESRFISQGFDYPSLYQTIKQDMENSLINSKVILVFDKNMSIEKNEFDKLVSLLESKEVILICSLKNKKIEDFGSEIIDISTFIDQQDDYAPDGIHLSDKGNEKLLAKINELLGQ